MKNFCNEILLLSIAFWTVASQTPVSFQSYRHGCPATAAHTTKSRSLIQQKRAPMLRVIHISDEALVRNRTTSSSSPRIHQPLPSSVSRGKTQFTRNHTLEQQSLWAWSLGKADLTFSKANVAWLATVQPRQQISNSILYLIAGASIFTCVVCMLHCHFHHDMSTQADDSALVAQIQESESRKSHQQHQEHREHHARKARNQKKDLPWYRQGPWHVEQPHLASQQSEIFPAALLGDLQSRKPERELIVPFMHSAPQGIAHVLNLGMQPKIRVELHDHHPTDGPGTMTITVHKIATGKHEKPFTKEWRESILARIDVPLCGGRNGFAGGGHVSITCPDGSVFAKFNRTRQGGYVLTPAWSQAQPVTFAGNLAMSGNAVNVIGPRGDLLATTEACAAPSTKAGDMIRELQDSHYLLSISKYVDASTVLCGILAIDALENMNPFEAS
eukprot:gnl/MRDRNA2_/MRDRNA2_107318_c0_seq1.p1 gnl/MRDRNA2_/MRDRNA2_107318_c0~~gnl/MRDRNA2_/MRDRNA2_107318_c0_seq1.p1  ORF type:complete len:444 (-),score=49.99 gnl/MRDRNA2_/MRDRNA2_107318_c0_seq1:69-1400(-)